MHNYCKFITNSPQFCVSVVVEYEYANTKNGAYFEAQEQQTHAVLNVLFA